MSEKKAAAATTTTVNATLFKASLVLTILSLGLRFMYYHASDVDTVNIPFGPALPLSFSGSKWGTLRSGAYFGMKSTSANSLVTGMMWFRNRLDPGNNLPIRHWCSQFDGLKRYGWLKHDFDSFGVQEIVDQDLFIRTDFIVKKENTWTARIRMQRVNDTTNKTPASPFSLVYYAATDGANDTIKVERTGFPFPKTAAFRITGTTAGIPDGFVMSVAVEVGQENVLFKSYMGSKASPPLVYLKESLMQNLVIVRNQDPESENLIIMKEQLIPHDSNFIAHQILFQDHVVIRIDFSGKDEDRISDYESQLEEKESQFSRDFESLFKLKEKGYTPDEVSFAESVVSNMMGSIGFFSGSSKVSSKLSEEKGLTHLHYGPFNLLTGVPSRSFFPRGFLWDEGFHNLLISRFRPDVSIQILRSWLSLMNQEGWIPREVILGSEAEARVPDEFVIQRNVNANPPTLFLTIESMMQRNVLPVSELKDMLPRLQLWYKWFNESQVGEKDSTYRWRGRNASAVHELNPKTLTSGLDDYPRASQPSDQEYHVDLRCWMALASRVMAGISRAVGEDGAEYQATADRLSDNTILDKHHWSEDHGMYCDYGMHSKKVKLVKRTDQKGHVTFHRKSVDPSSFTCVSEFGYVSLFPMLLQILHPSNPTLGILMLKMEKELLTEYGLRSLSKQSSYYNKKNTQHDAPYWRGAIWININFLAVKSLRFYSTAIGPFRETAAALYDKLRHGVIRNLVKEHRERGYLWEQYDDVTGHGKGSHPFTGWSALVVLLMAEDF